MIGRPGGVVAILLALGAAPALAQPPTVAVSVGDGAGCLDHLELVGEATSVALARESLAGGLLAELPASSCVGVELRVAREHDRWRFDLHKDGRTAQHEVQELASMVVWVESWLALPVTSIASTADATPQEPLAPERAEAPPEEAEDAEPEDPDPAPAAPAEAPRRATPIQLSLAGVVDFDRRGPVWPGGALSLQTMLSDRIFLALMVTGAWRPLQGQVTRRAFRFGARMGWQTELPHGVLQLGGGLGVVSGTARRQVSQTESYRDEETRAYLAAVARVTRHLGDHLGLTFAAELRSQLPDGFQRDDPVEPGEELEPPPLSNMALTLEVGLAFDVVRPD